MSDSSSSDDDCDKVEVEIVDEDTILANLETFDSESSNKRDKPESLKKPTSENPPLKQTVLEAKGSLQIQARGVGRKSNKISKFDATEAGAIKKNHLDACKKFWFPAILPNNLNYQITWIVTSLVLSILKYVFCVVGAVIIHDVHPYFKNALAVGIGVQCASTIVTCFITSTYSKLGVNISGPDIIAAIFAGSWAKTLTDPSQGKNMVTQAEAVPTLLFLIALSTCIMGLIWLCIGYSGATRVIDFMPQPVVSGFLACIGWKVAKYSIKVSVGSAWYHAFSPGFTWPFFMLLLPALPVGIPLYLLKRYHIGNPMLILPFYLLGPTLIFFIAFFAQAENSMEDMRSINWMFPDYPTAKFWEIWTELRWEHVAWRAIPGCIPDMAIMFLILIIDSFLKLSSTKGALKTHIDMIHEMKIAGWQNLLASLFVSAPGYPQVKFNILSFGILGNREDRKVGFFVGLFCGIMWLSGFMLVSYLPRFLLGGLLVYAACPFIVDNLIISYYHMSQMEYFAIWAIFATVVVADLLQLSFALLLAVVVGLVFSTIIFMLQYAQVSIIRNTYQGDGYQSKVVRTYWEEALISRVGCRSGYIQLEGFIFFASASQVMDAVRDMMENTTVTGKAYNRIRHLVLDFEYVHNMDYSGVQRMMELRRVLKQEKIQLYLSGLHSLMKQALSTEGMFQHDDDDGYCALQAEDMDRAAEMVEDRILERAAKLRVNWLIFDSFKKLHTEAQLRVKFELLEVALGSSADISHDLWKYGRPVEVKKGTVICKEGEHNNNIFLLQRGKVTSFTILDDEERTIKRLRTCTHGAVINDECLFHDLPCSHSTVADEDCLLWKVSVSRLGWMETVQPKLAVKLHRHILSHAAVCRHRLEREVESLESHDIIAGARERKRNAKEKHRRRKRFGRKGKSRKQKKEILKTKDVGHSLGDRVLNKIRDAHREAVQISRRGSMLGGMNTHEQEEIEMGAHTLVEIEAMQHHHKHHYHHLHVDRHLESEMTEEELKRWSDFRPHMSKIQEDNAKKWFTFHAKEHQHVEKTGHSKLDTSQSSRTSPSIGAMNNDASPHFNQLNSPVISNRSSEAFEAFDLNSVGESMVSSSAGTYESGGISNLVLDLGEVQKALMDLGLFPSIMDVRKMHATLGHNRIDDNIDQSEFLKMVEVMTLAEVSPAQVRSLYGIFEKYSVTVYDDDDDDDHSGGGDDISTEGQSTINAEHKVGTNRTKRGLGESNLGELLSAMGHPDDSIELHCIMSEWDVLDRGYLDFEALLSIVATYLRIEQLDQQVEKDFLLLCGYNEEEQRTMTAEQKEEAEVSPEMLFDAVMKYGSGRMKRAFTRQQAEEMVYDADLQHIDNKISIDELVTCLEMVGDKEALEESDEKRAMWRAPSGRHLALKKKSNEQVEWEQSRMSLRSNHLQDKEPKIAAKTIFNTSPASASNVLGSLKGLML